MSLPYGRPGTKLARGQAADPEVIRALQTDLRRLGYVRSGLDGGFGPETERAVRALDPSDAESSRARVPARTAGNRSGTGGHRGVPDRAAFGWDWPYAVRRYNGGGVDSYHYQAQVLLRFVKDPKLDSLLGPS
jgi:hypothetical protein